MSDLPARTLVPAGRETRDLRLGFLAALLAFILAVLVAMLGLAYWIFPAELADRRFAQPFPAFPAPRLQPSPRADMQAFYAEEMARLGTAGWQDRQAGRVHIPIDQAMRAVAAEGIPGWPSGPQASLGDRR